MELYSDCCDANPMGETNEFEGTLYGICGNCKEWSDFSSEIYDDSIDWEDEMEYMREHQ